MKGVLVKLSILIGILLVTFFGRYLILDRAHPVVLKPGGISTAVEQALQNTSSGTYLPIQDKDYTLDHVQYFNNRQWAVVSIKPIGTYSDSGMIVFEQKSGSYQLVLGPGSSFVGTDLSSLPNEVAKYINP